MQGKGWLYGYGLTAILHGLSILANWGLVRFVTKPLLMIVLLVFFLLGTNGSTRFRKWISAALLCSWLGDIFLMNEGETYFIAGLASFLVAHLCYIFFFMAIRRKNAQAGPWNIVILAALALYAGLFYFFLAPHLTPTLKLPVLVYALVIAAMFVMAFHAFNNKKSDAALWCITGAALFILSDSLLAINSFVQAFSGAGLAIMGTYILAQLAIVLGAKQLLNSKLNTV
ncbi:lysoplasmalogenase [Flavihumibacter fluvii]|uniref:lysoplasmalogenase n=1 Tax=Flavihumibacter fluvii TaxID=2838157 RepID=UPI001BDEFAF6|nr:lysoplasmalogenase [Flavihumibacter fluvii]ULQ52340.1 lysoplasmalogenase [Flavihumibacter fluvii]